MAITLPRAIKSAAYRSRSGSGDCALTRSSSAGNFLAFGEVVMPPCSAPRSAALIWATLPYPLDPCNKSLPGQPTWKPQSVANNQVMGMERSHVIECKRYSYLEALFHGQLC